MCCLFAFACALHANAQTCEERVSHAAARVERDVAELSIEQRARLNVILMGLCEERAPGSSVTRTEEGTAYTTHGLQPERAPSDEDQLNAIIGIEVPRYGRRHRPMRPIAENR
jgi:hypothetical protein